MCRDTVPGALIRKYHVLRLLDTRDRPDVAVHPLVGDVHDARRAEDVPVGVESRSTGEAGWVIEGERGFEAGAGEDGEDFAGAVEVDAFVASELR